MRKRREQRFLVGISQAIMFAEDEWLEEERRINKHDKCRFVCPEVEEETQILDEILEIDKAVFLDTQDGILEIDPGEAIQAEKIHIEKLERKRKKHKLGKCVSFQFF